MFSNANSTGEWAHAHPSKIERIRRHLLGEQAGTMLAETFKVLGDTTRVLVTHQLDVLAQWGISP